MGDFADMNMSLFFMFFVCVSSSQALCVDCSGGLLQVFQNSLVHIMMLVAWAKMAHR